MSKLTIDFGPRRRSAAQCLGWLVLLVASVLFALEGWSYFRDRQARQLLDVALAQLRTHRATSTGAKQAELPAPPKDEMRRAVQTIHRINAPWDRLFDGIEATMDENTALLGLEPDFDRREIKLRVEARNMDSMLSHLRRINSTSGLSDAYLDTHQIHIQDPLRPLRFTVIAHWNVLPQADGSTAIAQKQP